MSLDAIQVLMNQGNQFKELGDFESAIAQYQEALTLNPQNLEIYKSLVELYALTHQNEIAIDWVKKALELDPDFASIYLVLGNALQQNQKFNLAIWAYSQALDLQPNFVEAHANLGSLYYQMQRFPEAADCYKVAISLHPQWAILHWMLGNALMQESNVERAILAYQNAIELQPNEEQFYLKLGRAFVQLQNPEEAIQCYQTSLNLHPEWNLIAQELKQMIADSKGIKHVSETVDFLGDMGTDEQFYEAGIELAHSELEQQPQTQLSPEPKSSLIASETTQFFVESPIDLPEEDTPAEVEVLKKQAEQYVDQGRFEEAILACHQALKQKPNYLPAYVVLGNTLQLQKKFNAALRAYSQVLEIQPNFAEVQANIGTIYFRQGQWDEAILNYQKALDMNPNLAAVYWNLGKAYQYKHEDDKAIEVWNKALELKPDLVEAEFNFEFGSTLARRERWEEALQSYQRALALKPNWAEAYGNIASIKTQQQKYEEAIDYYQKAIEIKNDIPELYLYLAGIYFKQRRYSEAIQQYHTLIKVHPDSANAYANLGLAYAKLGQLEKAIESYQKTISIKPDWAEIYCRMAHLQKHEQPLEAIANLEKAIELDPTFYEAHQQLCDLLSHSTNLSKARNATDFYCQTCGEKVPILSAIAYIFAYLQSGLATQALQKLVELENICYSNPEAITLPEIGILYELLLFTVSHLRDDLEANIKYYKFVTQNYTEKRCALLKSSQKNQKQLPLNPQVFIPSQPLKIGFISKHFRRHSVGWCSEAVIREMATLTPHVHLYVTGQLPPDEVTQRFEQFSSKLYWPKAYPSGFADAEEISAEIIKDQLDIVVDLDSMTVPANVQVLYLSPAPVRVSWLGFDAPYISPNNYFLCDEYTHPKGREKYYVEKLIRLPETSVAIDGLQSRPVDRKAVRRNFGIREDQIMYLCVAPGRKTNLETVQAQIRILKAVPDSVLVRKGQGDPQVIREIYTQECEAQNIDINRIIFLGLTKTEEEHRAIYQVADVLLDSYPYNGGTHNLEALWSNLPVVTRAGEQYLSRMGYSFLKAANLDVGVGWTWEEYTQWGIKFGVDVEFRNQVKSHLIQSKHPDYLAPLWNPQKLARQMYEVFVKLRQM